MPQPKKGPRLGSGPAHQRLMLSNLAVSLFLHERITTTEAKAKMLRPYAERLITKAKKGDVHNRRQVLSTIEDRDVVHKLFDEIAPRFADRNGGYTRILKLEPRHGDGAPMALIELLDTELVVPGASDEETETSRRGRRTRREAVAADADVSGDDELVDDEPMADDVAGADEAGGEPDDADEDVGEAAADGEEPVAEAEAPEAEAPEAEAPEAEAPEAEAPEAEEPVADAEADPDEDKA